MQLALDKSTGDLIKGVNGGVERVDKGRFTVQQVQSKLRTWLGEWRLNPTIGWVNFDDFNKSYDQFDIETRARRIILETQDVLAIDSMEVTYKNRKLSILFEAKTTYGTISLTVPWE
tara:strand:+ start:2017 stop:2367 length:351 start_codon:yes stop_codon:yes gene_type:complete